MTPCHVSNTELRLIPMLLNQASRVDLRRLQEAAFGSSPNPCTTQRALQVLLEGACVPYAQAEVMKWLVKGLGQMNWQDRGAPAINTVSRESISQYLWYVGDTFLLLKDQSMLVASARSVKKDH